MKRGPYTVISISMYDDDLQALDANIRKMKGVNPLANRSLLIRETLAKAGYLDRPKAPALCAGCGHSKAYHRHEGETPSTDSWLCAYPVHPEGTPCNCDGFVSL